LPHTILEELCTGCTVCEAKCPTNAIAGGKKVLHVIDPERCIDCRACGRWCPYHAIEDDYGEVVPYNKAKDVPRAEVIAEDCTGCDICVVVCPFDAITLVPYDEGAFEHQFASHMGDNKAYVDPKKCTGCQLCEDVCIKHAIRIDYGHRDGPSDYQQGMIFHGAYHGGNPTESSNQFLRHI
jgi:electron transport complex protein RnfB